MIAYAATVDDLLIKLNVKIFNPIIEFAFIVAFVVFIWGVMEYIRGANNEEKRKHGRDHMLWGVIGFVIMFGVFGIISLLLRTFGIKGGTFNKDHQDFTPPPLQELKLPK